MKMKEMELAGMGQYAHGNQPIQHMPYLYSYAGQPWKTQYWVRQIVERLYNSTERGYPGDEDQGRYVIMVYLELIRHLCRLSGYG